MSNESCPDCGSFDTDVIMTNELGEPIHECNECLTRW